MTQVQTSLTNVSTPPCQHQWERAPERDTIAGMPVRTAVLVFWCRKCLKTEARRVSYDGLTSEAGEA